ncbi:MAG: S26 family signal peptidase [Spirochaetaceae bacterium]|jgi:signal peptidase I|nr:S26 family signal peptidase [Spirochaetaceae bacterium]
MAENTVKNNSEKTDIFDRLQAVTEWYLTRRKRIRRIKKEKQQAKNPVLDWLEAFIWAAGMVLLINQYLFQAYQIPSGSMIDALLIGDRVFVNKIIFGPELLPGVGKLPSPVKPRRNNVIIFENPSYSSLGPAFDIAQRIIYMLTLSIIDIDRDEDGQPKAHFLIKRAVGWGGDQITQEQGELNVRFSGETRWVAERDFNEGRGFGHRISRIMEQDGYPALEARGKIMAYRELGLAPPALLESAAAPVNAMRYPDLYAYDRARLEVLRAVQPQKNQYRAIYHARYARGWYVPEGRILPLGDNRDNSRDGRYFGPIKESKVLGKGFIIYWPLGRLGPIR